MAQQISYNAVDKVINAQANTHSQQKHEDDILENELTILAETHNSVDAIDLQLVENLKNDLITH